jgi:hypothetical protein
MGGAYALLGGYYVFVGGSWFGRPAVEPWEPLISLFGIIPAFLIVIGVAHLLLSVLGLLAGLGILLHRQWGRILGFILAGLAILSGMTWLAGGEPEMTEIALGAPQILYGILAAVTLALTGAEFARPYPRLKEY